MCHYEELNVVIEVTKGSVCIVVVVADDDDDDDDERNKFLPIFSP